jgi:hypothetical protein
MRGKLLFFLFYGVSLSAFNLSLEISDSKGLPLKHVKQGVPFLITVIAHDAFRDVGEPFVEHLDKLDVCEKCPVTTNISIINGHQEMTKTFAYRARIDKKGAFSLGPASYERSNTLYKSKALSFKVRKGVENPREEQHVQDPFVHVSLNKHDIYQKEQTILTIRLCYRQPVLRFALEQFNMPVFAVRELQQPTQEEFEHGGHMWRAIVYRYALYPQQAGDLIIPSLGAIVEREKEDKGDSFFGRFRTFFGSDVEKFRIHSKETIALHVSSLPQSEKQIDLVGKVKSFTASLDKSQLEQGKGAVLTLQVVSDGDVLSMPLTSLNLPEDVRLYYSKGSVGPLNDPRGFWQLKKEWVLQVLDAGKVTIPAQKLTFFDPEKKNIKTVSSLPLTLAITERSVGASPIELNGEAIKEKAVPFLWPFISVSWFIILSLFPFLLLFGFYVLQLYKPVVEKVRAYRHFYRALIIAGRREDAHGVYEAWVNLFVDRLDIPQREKDLSAIGVLFLEGDLASSWRIYVEFLEQMAFEKRKDEFKKLNIETRRWISTMKGRL